MHTYELMVILDPEVDERTVAPSLDKFLTVITKSGGSIENVDIWGKRRMAYEIKTISTPKLFTLCLISRLHHKQQLS